MKRKMQQGIICWTSAVVLIIHIHLYYSYTNLAGVCITIHRLNCKILWEKKIIAKMKKNFSHINRLLKSILVWLLPFKITFTIVFIDSLDTVLTINVKITDHIDRSSQAILMHQNCIKIKKSFYIARKYLLCSGKILH